MCSQNIPLTKEKEKGGETGTAMEKHFASLKLATLKNWEQILKREQTPVVD